MTDILIGIHAGLGELGILAAMWIFVELLNPTKERVRRAKIASVLLVVFMFSSWLAGGAYYVNVYGPEVKPIIKAGPTPWAHGVFTETKEHVFLFLPFLSIFLATLLFRSEKTLLTRPGTKYGLLAMAGVIFLIGFSMIGMGYIISSGVRVGLEAGIV